MLLMHIKMNADQLKAEPNIPRVAKKQIHRDNVAANLHEEYYKRARR